MLEAGQQKGKGAYLCYPAVDPIYKFGIDSAARLAFYYTSPTNNGNNNDQLLWHAAPVAPDTPACVVFGECQSPVQFFRMRASGDLVGFSPDRTRAWESHGEEVGAGEWSVWAAELGMDGGGDARQSEMRPGSTLEVTDAGVLIRDGDVVTWRLDAPPKLDTTAPTAAPTKRATSAPTDEPTVPPTPNADAVSVSGTLFFDSDNDGLIDATDPDRPPDALAAEAAATAAGVLNQVVVDLYDCATDEWILITRASAGASSNGANSNGDPNGAAATTGYQFTLPLSGGGTTPNLSPRLSELGVASIRAEFALPSAALGEFEFVPPGKDSDVDPATGRTACWDLSVDGRGEIAWNAGVRTVGAVEDSAEAPTGEPTMKPAPAMGGNEAGLPAPAPTGGIVGGYAFLDRNDDGIRDLTSATASEPALADVEVRLFSCPAATGAANFAATTESGKGGEALLGVQRTDDRGFYSFRNLFSGSYRVKVVPPPGHKISAAWNGGGNDGGNDSGVDNAVDPASGATDCFPLEGGATDLRWDVGLAPLEESAAPAESPVEEAPAAIAGFVFEDANNNGYLDDGEAALPGVRVALADCDGAVIKVANTDPNGMYGFASVPPGRYELRFSLDDHRPSDVWTGWLDEEGKLIAGDAQNDANPATGSTACKEYGPGATVLDVDAGLISILEGEAPSPAVVATVAPNGLPDGPTDGAPSTKPTARPTVDPKGDGTACSGAACPVEGMCRSKAGLCGNGIGFCNPSAVWDAGCPAESEPAETPPTAAPVDVASAAPALSASPTRSPSPTPLTAVATPGTEISLPDGTICNPDGSYGVASGTSSPLASAGEGAATAVEVSFTYALQSDDGAPPGPELVARFETQLNDRLACVYFDDDCLSCEASGGKRLRGRRRNREGGSVLGLSSLPKDLLNLFEVCSGGAAADDCRVIDGKFTAHYPARMTPRELLEANNQMLAAVERELAADDWDGLRASYANAPFPAPVEKSATGDDDDGGTSAGAIVGIVIAVLALVALAAAGGVLFVRRKREKDEEEFAAQQQSRAVPFGDSVSLSASKGDDSDEESDSDDESSSGSSSSSSSSSSGDSSSSESEEKDSVRDSKGAATALSGDTYPTNVAQARSADIEDGESDSYSGSDDGGSYDEQQSEVTAGQPPSVAHDEGAGAYDDGGGYIGGQYDDNYAVEGGQAYAAPGNYTGQAQDDGYDDDRRGLPDADDAGSMFSDPPGTSYRDLPQEEEWDHAVAAPLQEQYPLQRTNQGDSSGSFRVYENEAGMSDSYHSFNNHQADGSYHSQHSGRSFHSQRSARSNHSRHSQEEALQQANAEAQYSQVHPQQQAYDDGAQYDDFRQASFHSTHSHHSQADDAQSNPGSYHSGSQHSGRSFHSQRSHHSRHSPEEIRQHVGGDGAHYSGQENEVPQFGQEYPQAQPGYEYDMNDGGNEATYGGHNGGGGTNYDEASYHSFNPVSAPARPEELDEVSHGGSAATRQVSNKSSPMQQPKQSARPGHEAMGEEESINRIFNSLSDIQSRLASKGEHGQWMEPVDEAYGS
ncbi:hypothetical protein ACHAXT_003732 [Thalassiosira profunda]